MTLGVGNHLAKLKQTYASETNEATFGPGVVEGEAYHEFEIKALYGNQGDPQGFAAVLKLVK